MTATGEIQRLNQLDDQVLAQSHQVEDAYDQVLGIHTPELPAVLEEADSEQLLAAESESPQAMLSATAA